MKSFSRISVPALVGVVLLGLGGCAENNESAISEAQRANAGKGEVGAGTAVQDQGEYFKNQQKLQQEAYTKGSGYPGAK
jgi:hypothetical protein